MTKFSKTLLICALTLALCLAVLNFAQALTLTGPSGSGGTGAAVTTLSGKVGINTVAGKIISVLIGVAGAFALLMFVYGGFTWIIAKGDSSEITKGKNILIYSTVGIVICLFAFVIVDFWIFALTGQYTAPATGKPPAVPSGCTGTCLEKTATITGCDALTPPLKSATGTCTPSAGKDFICCEAPTDVCAGVCTEKTAATCETLATPMVSVATYNCAASQIKNPGKEFLCCAPPADTCASPATCVEKTADTCEDLATPQKTATGDCAGQKARTGKDFLCCETPPPLPPTCEWLQPYYPRYDCEAAGWQCIKCPTYPSANGKDSGTQCANEAGVQSSAFKYPGFYLHTCHTCAGEFVGCEIGEACCATRCWVDQTITDKASPGIPLSGKGSANPFTADDSLIGQGLPATCNCQGTTNICETCPDRNLRVDPDVPCDGDDPARIP